MGRKLGVLDFDHTILDDNSDTAILALIRNEVPEEIRQLQKSEGWIPFMQEMFKHMHSRGIKEQEIKSLVVGLPPVPGMAAFIRKLKVELDYDLIIISDSNSVFIKAWLGHQNLEEYFSHIFTNPCQVVNGSLKISPYHHQESCKLSTKNMCKGQILEDFLKKQQEEGVVYERVMYVGDGVNDFCPVLRLKQSDLACARKDYKLVELIEKAKKGACLDHTGNPHVVKAEVFVWSSANEIVEHLKGV